MIELSCSFCGMEQRIVEKLIAGPSAYICNRCVEELDHTVGMPPTWNYAEESALRCSFCNKCRGDVARMFARSGSLICNQCVGIAQALFGQDRVPPRSPLRRLAERFSRVLGRCVKFWFPALLSTRSETQSDGSRSKHALSNSCLKQASLVVRREHCSSVSARSFGVR